MRRRVLIIVAAAGLGGTAGAVNGPTNEAEGTAATSVGPQKICAHGMEPDLQIETMATASVGASRSVAYRFAFSHRFAKPVNLLYSAKLATDTGEIVATSKNAEAMSIPPSAKVNSLDYRATELRDGYYRMMVLAVASGEGGETSNFSESFFEVTEGEYRALSVGEFFRQSKANQLQPISPVGVPTISPPGPRGRQ
jgi:hypothetical protein